MAIDCISTGTEDAYATDAAITTTPQSITAIRETSLPILVIACIAFESFFLRLEGFFLFT